ncbi:MAG: hypothetical protein SH868_09040 [Bythopirellula sp.]|nr:hypothetical protein [Bythopirellula sp.]
MLLLVILGMLTLFLMIGTAFISSSNQYRRANKSYSKVGEQKNLKASQEGFLGEVINQLIRDTSNQNSALRYHSLLRDMYGTEGFIAPRKSQSLTAGGPAFPNNPVLINFAFAGVTDGIGNVTNGQFLEFTLPNYYQELSGKEWLATGTTANSKSYTTADNGLSGMIVTFLEGPAKGYSTRIVGYNTTNRRVRILNFPAENNQPINSLPFLASLNATSRILINGRPFNGTGVGYNSLAAPGTAKLNAAEQVPGMPDQTTLPTPIALMPNAAFFEPSIDPTIWSVTSPLYYGITGSPTSIALNLRQYDGLGGSDETYDAPDFQNMYLAWTSPNPGEMGIHNFANVTTYPTALNDPGPDDTFGNSDDRGGLVLPSFHRPELINYWANQTASTPGDLTTATLGLTGGVPFLRKILLRPNWHDHPDFDGSNPEFAALRGDAQEGTKKLLRSIYGPWDVDNDNDGVRDSIWVDFGAPVMVGSKGRLVKPLAAIMVLDMDGRLNVNAHGTRELAGIGDGLDAPPMSNPAPTVPPPTPGTEWDNIPRGQAFGVAEITLGPVLGNKYDNLLEGGSWFGKDWTGRYGSDEEAGSQDDFDLSAQLKMQGFPLNLPQRSNFGSLSDLRGRYKSALNEFGQFVTTWTPTDSNNHSLVEDNPYEEDISLTGARGEGTSVDNPFSLAELERVLRVFDLDSGTLSPRLFELLKGSQSTANPDELRNWRTLLTTDSYDLPEPGVQLPAWVRVGIDGVLGTPDDYETVMGKPPINGTFADLVEYRYRLSQNPIWNKASDNATRITALRTQLNRVIAPEMMAGLPLDLNRPFGNGRDDNNNAVVDEPGEYFDANSNGSFDVGEGEIGWLIDDTRLSPNEAANVAKDEFEGQYGIYRDDHDRNGDGTIDAAEQALNNPTDLVGLVNLHNYRRQLMARQLYMLAMAVVDPIPPLALSSVPVNLRKEKIKLHRETIAEQSRSLAQWAINVVDHRDPDNIMTAFEYDTIPFNGWQVDEDIRTTSDLPNWSDNGVSDSTPTPNSLIDREDPEELAFRNGTDDDGDGLVDDADPDEIAERQVVWGMERPELVMTETLAWHDRATWDGDDVSEDAVTDENGDGKVDDKDVGQVGTGGGNFDIDYDQRARPQGATFIELYNPWGVSPGASADTHLIDPNTGNDLGIDLVAVDRVNGTSPVWRIDVRKTVDYVGVNPSVAARLGRYVGGPDHDPDDPDYRVQPRIPDRCIYFTNFDPESRFPIRSKPELPKWETTWDDDGVAFYSSLTQPRAAVDGNNPVYIRNHAVVRPGGYMVVGSGIPVDAGGQPVVPTQTVNPNIARYEARVGDKKRTSTDQRHAVVLDPFATGAQPSVIVRDRLGTPLQDQAGFAVSATADTTSVAIIDSVWFRNINRIGPSVRNEGWEYRRFSVSEPASGYPHAVFGSDWRGSYYNDPDGEYKPNSLDIPLDNQRWGKTSYLSGNVVDGQPIIGITSPRWMRKSGPADRTATFELQKDNELRLTLPEKEKTSVRTIPAFSWLYLQRLANPLLPWNPLPGFEKHRPGEIVNPYMTVDSMGVNVTVFNGQESVEKRRQEGVVKDYGNADAIRSFASLQRGRMNIDDIEQLRGRIRDSQGHLGEPSTSTGIPLKVPDTSFRNLPNASAFPKDISVPARFRFSNYVRDPHEGNDGTGRPFAIVPGNLWGEEQIGKVDSKREDMTPALKYPVGLWGNRAGAASDGLYRAASQPSASHFFHSLPDCTLGFMNEPFRRQNPANDLERKFIPAQPFPLIAWNNRPYANAGELMQVPAFRSSQILKVFGMSKGVPTTEDTKGFFVEKYRGYIRRGTYPPVLLDSSDPGDLDSNVAFPPIAADGPFGHLPNYFRALMNHDPASLTESVLTPAGKNKPYYQGNAGFHRVMDYVTVPSLFVGGETWLNPVTFGDTTTQITSTVDPRYGLQPPFNKVVSRREPGRVNINTIAGEGVWNALFHGDVNPYGAVDRNGDGIIDEYMHAGPTDNKFAASRRGYGLENDKDPTTLDPLYPTVFANPFRTSDCGFLVPLNNMVFQGVDATLGRHDHPIKGNDGQWGVVNVDENSNGIVDDLLEQGMGTNYDDTTVPLNGATTSDIATTPAIDNLFRNAPRNPYFRYSPISRLSSMTTTRSNVFAVWVTIGFFEVEEVEQWADLSTAEQARYGDSIDVYNRVYPDGYRFGKEDGIETGENERVREFAIIDRTIPVAFEPGANHNAQETIRLRRKIE